MCEVFFVTHCVDDAGQQCVERALKEAGLLGVGTPGCIAPHRSLYCSTRCAHNEDTIQGIGHHSGNIWPPFREHSACLVVQH